MSLPPLFDLKGNSFSLTNALSLSMYSGLVYEKLEDINTMLHHWNLPVENFFFISEKNTVAIILSTREYIIVSFRGTEPMSLKDWVTDFLFWPKRISNESGKVHSGVYYALECISEQLRDALFKTLDNNQVIFYTGHSLGGSLALLAGSQLTKFNIHPDAIYTFGAFKIGNNKFVANYPNRNIVYQIVNSNDIVPRLPLINFSPIGTEYYIDRHGHISTSIPFWDRMSDHVLSRLINYKFFGGITEHSVDKYICSISDFKASSDGKI